ncbi:hypothetical protein [Amycolatopsis rhizosphaerae]|uniref:hypothetical protein n=1 Tax=Amycolatopsis rhizosphaerae TaxID=2053003 RepID=UPI001FE80082|nr:hypothetical protein [Amycolatopsis rhizosphaerae]
MTSEYLSPSQRRAVAEEALAQLGADRRKHVVLRVRCGRSHHVASVYDTGAGRVVATQTGTRAHGSRDFVDVAHHGTRAPDYVDLLEADTFSEDLLPAGCECGNMSLSREELRRSIESEQRVLQVP